MFIWLPESTADLVLLKVVGRLNDADCRDALPKLIDVAARHGAVRLLADMSEFDGMEWHNSYDQSAFGKPHWDKVKRVALVGASNWPVLAARVVAVLAPIDVRIFDAGKFDAALDWVKSDTPLPL